MSVLKVVTLAVVFTALIVITLVTWSARKMMKDRKVDLKKFREAVRTVSITLISTGVLGFTGLLIAAKSAGLSAELIIICITFDVTVIAVSWFGIFYSSKKGA